MPRFNEATMAALDQSIEKWAAKMLPNADRACGADHCPLCTLFNSHSDNFTWPAGVVHENCLGCPIFGYTGGRYCDRTPYEEYEDLQDASIEDDALLVAAAGRMCSFLRAVREWAVKENQDETSPD